MWQRAIRRSTCRARRALYIIWRIPGRSVTTTSITRRTDHEHLRWLTVRSNFRSGVLRVVFASTLTACGQARTSENFCSSIAGKTYQRAMRTGQAAGPIDSLGSLLAAPSYFANLFDKLDDLAPDDIEPDVAGCGMRTGRSAAR